MEIHTNIACPSCYKTYEADLMALTIVCPNCDHKLSRIDQVAELLDEWYYPRRWRRDIDQPRARLLIERLWQQQFEPNELYATLAPTRTNFERFCYTITTVVIRGIDNGWARLDLPEDPLIDDPIYKLEILDQAQFSAEMESMMPDVAWDEAIDVVDPNAPAAGNSGAREAKG